MLASDHGIEQRRSDHGSCFHSRALYDPAQQGALEAVNLFVDARSQRMRSAHVNLW